jgi:kelch-like protein 17 (actinfilin)
MTTARSGAGAAVLDGKIYVVGGRDSTTQLATVEVSNPATKAWSQAPPMITARETAGVAALGGKLYVAGGSKFDFDEGGALSSVEVFDPQTNAWTALAPMSTPRSLFAMAAVQGKIYAAGGYGTGGYSNDVATVEAFDPHQNRLEAAAPMATARKSMAWAAI